MRRGTPNASMRCIASGSAASDDVVEKAMIAGSRTWRMKPRIGIRASSATGSSARRTNAISAPHSVPTSLSSGSSTVSPLCDTVTASAAPTAIGTYFMMMPTTLNIASAKPFGEREDRLLGRPAHLRQPDGE